MKRLVLLSMMLLVGLCTGCAVGTRGTLPDVGDGSNAAEIYVFRPYNYVAVANSTYISFDNVEIFALRTVQYTKFLAPSGTHTLGARYPGLPAKNISIELVAGQKYYYSISPGFSSFKLTPVTEEEAAPHIEGAYYVPLNDGRNSEVNK